MKLRWLLPLIPCLLLVTCAGVTLARRGTVDLPNFGYWSAKELRDYEKPLREKTGGPNKTSSIKLADYGSSNVAISHREADGIPEVHAQMDDYFIVESGAATLVIGGEVVNAKQVEPGETRGDAIKGGERRNLAAGDVVHIPTNMPHQLLVEKGKVFTYFVIKVKAK
jgi:mannose-6-phosphate isomerase-like protein (cupin superfamily)